MPHPTKVVHLVPSPVYDPVMSIKGQRVSQHHLDQGLRRDVVRSALEAEESWLSTVLSIQHTAVPAEETGME